MHAPPFLQAAQVYKAFLYGVHPVAVKVFQTQDDVPADDFWREISILRTCRHGNIVQFQVRRTFRREWRLAGPTMLQLNVE